MSTNHLPATIAKAVEQQQARLWSLRSLVDLVLVAVQNDGRIESVDDMEAALVGIIELADSVHEALDEQAIADRAAELAEDQAQREAFTGASP